MSVYGQLVSVLNLYGGPGKTLGMFYRRIMLPISFYLQIGGPVSIEFTTPEALQNFQACNSGVQVTAYILDQLANPLNISSASATYLLFLRPDGTSFNRIANFVTNGYDGGIYYLTTESDFTQVGNWQLQASFSLAGDLKTTRWSSFQVASNINSLTL